MLRMRWEFTERVERMHERTLAKHSAMKSRKLEDMAYEVWRKAQKR